MSFLQKHGVTITANAIATVVILLFLTFFTGNRGEGPEKQEKPQPIYNYDPPDVYYTFSPQAPPVPVSSQEQPLPAVIDTMAILHKYYTDHYYEQEWTDTSAGVYVKVMDSIGENRIKWMKFQLHNFRPVSAICPDPPTPEKKRNKLFYGLNAGFEKGKFAAGPSLEFMNKNDLSYGLHFNIMNGIKQPDVRASVLTKFSFFRRRNR